MSDRPIPRRVYLDTSVVVGAVISGTKNSNACAAYCQRLIQANSQIFFSEILLLELSEAIRRLATIPGHIPPELSLAFQLDQWERSLFVRQRWMAHGVQQFETLMSRFSEAFVLPIRRSTWLASTRVMANEQLRSHDAVHTATALVPLARLEAEVVVRKQSQPRPKLQPVTAALVFRMYGHRWASGDAVKVAETGLGWEDVQVLAFEAVRRPVALGWVATGFPFDLGVTLGWGEVRLLRRLGGGEDRPERPPGKRGLARGRRRLPDYRAMAAILADEAGRPGGPPRIAAMRGHPAPP